MIGGGNLTEFYQIPTNGTFTGTPTALMRMNKTVSTNFDKLIKQGATVDFDHILNTSKFAKFLDDNTTATAASGVEEIVFENGGNEGSSGGGDPKLFFVTYCGTEVDGTDTRRQIIYGCCELTEVGGFKMEGNKYTRRAFKFKTVKATKDLTLVAAMFDDTFIDTADTTGVMPLSLTVEKNLYGKEAWPKVP